MADEPEFLPEKWPTTPDTPLEHAPGEKSRRWHRRMERLQRVREMSGIEHVRVVPRDEKVRRQIGHPLGGKFPARGSKEWPNDQFTQNRITDGTVSIEPGSRPIRRIVESRRPTVGTTPPQARATRSAPPPPRPPVEPKT